MSLISDLLDRLNDLSDSPRLTPDEQRLINEAMDTIEVQSAKIVAHNLHGGWISCEKMFPQTDGSYLVCTAKSKPFTMHYYATSQRFSRCNGLITHWMELPGLPEMELLKENNINGAIEQGNPAV